MMDANDKIYVTLIVISIIILLILLGFLGFFFGVWLGVRNRSIYGGFGTGFRFGDSSEPYRNGEGVLGTEAESRGITALTSHTPPELRPFNTRT